jgi:hypothetical protein
MPNERPLDRALTKADSTLAAEDRAELRILATRTLKRVLGDDAPSRNAGVQVTAANAILDRVWPKPSVSANVQVNVLVNGGVTAIERWERRHEEEDEVAGASRSRKTP